MRSKKQGQTRHPAAKDNSDNNIYVCGIHAVAALLQQQRVNHLYISDNSGASLQSLIDEATATAVPMTRESRQALSMRVQEEHHQGVVAKALLPVGDMESILASGAPLVVLDGVTDPRNLGAIMRVTRAFAAAAVILPARRSAPLSVAAMRAAAGAVAEIPLLRVTNIARTLRQVDAAGYTIVAAVEDGSDTLFSEIFPQNTCWVLGDEGVGIRRLVREHCHLHIRIPTIAGEGGCLNVASACAVCLSAGRSALRE
ncbi:MAG: RNA methyltransferase [Proteobacteria bacterium]|nr:RNA methyltransferase [Pseudomonadota bacterium]